MNRSDAMAILCGHEIYREVESTKVLQFGVEKATDKIVTAIDGNLYEVSEEARNLFSSAVGVPSPYTAKNPAWLNAINLNYWAVQHGQAMRAVVEDPKPQPLQLTDGPVASDSGVIELIEPDKMQLPVIRAFTRVGATKLLNMEQVLESVEDALDVKIDDLNYHRAHWSLDRVSFSIVGPKTTEVRKGDIFQAGITFDWTPNDQMGLSIQGYNLRLVCTNGAFATDIVHKINRRHVPADIYTWIGEAVGETWSKANDQFDLLRKAADTILPEEHLGETLLDLYNQFKVPVTVRELIEDRVKLEGVTTVFDLYNHLTYVATHNTAVAADVQLQSRLMQSAGNMANHAALCMSCHRPMSS